MRIISGFLKGKKILQPKDLFTRPLKDMVKESIFNIISHSNKFNVSIKNSNILDLFSGVGSFGIECLSREAKKVFFVENYANVLPVLKTNLTKLGLNENSKIFEFDIENKENLNIFDTKFDIIFLYPPFKTKNCNQLILNIFEKNLLEKNGIIVIHRHKNENEILSDSFKIFEEKKYGLSKIFFLGLH